MWILCQFTCSFRSQFLDVYTLHVSIESPDHWQLGFDEFEICIAHHANCMYTLEFSKLFISKKKSDCNCSLSKNLYIFKKAKSSVNVEFIIGNSYSWIILPFPSYLSPILCIQQTSLKNLLKDTQIIFSECIHTMNKILIRDTCRQKTFAWKTFIKETPHYKSLFLSHYLGSHQQ